MSRLLEHERRWLPGEFSRGCQVTVLRVILESFPGDLLGRLRGRALALRLLPRLAGAGITWRSLLLYPVRRRLAPSRSQLDVAGGGPVMAAADEPLLALFGEIWAERCYAPSRPLVPGEVI